MGPIDFRFRLLAQVLDASALRHRVLAQNVANVNTPGYRRLEVTFEDDLAKAMQNPGDPKVAPHVVAAEGSAERADGNNVDIDREMNELTKNALLYNATAQILSSRIASMRAAITGK